MTICELEKYSDLCGDYGGKGSIGAAGGAPYQTYRMCGYGIRRGSLSSQPIQVRTLRADEWGGHKKFSSKRSF